MTWKIIRKITSIVILITFLSTNVIYAAPGPRKTLRVPLGFAREKLLEQEQTGLPTKEMLLMMAQAVAMRMDDESILMDLGTTFFNTAFRRNLGSPIEIRRNKNTGTVHIRYNDRYISITRSGNISVSSRINFDKAELVIASIKPLVASSSDPTDKKDRTIGSLLGLMETFADLGLKPGEKITINDIIPERKKQDGTLYSRTTVSREFKDAVALDLLRLTGNKIKNSNEYEVLKSFTREQLSRLPGHIRKKLNRGRIRSDEIEELRRIFIAETLMGQGTLLKVFLAGLAGFQEALADIPYDLSGANTETVQSLFTAVENIVFLARDFDKKDPAYAEAYIYESLGFVDIDGKRRLALVITPFEDRRKTGSLDVLVFDSLLSANYTSHAIKATEIEMVSTIVGRLDEKDIISLSLKFRAEYLDNPDGPGTSDTRRSAKDFFLYFASKRNATQEILDLDEELIDGLEGRDLEIKERMARLKEGVSDKDLLDEWFIEIMQGKDTLVQYLLYTGDAATFWYDLLLELDYTRAINEMFLSRPDAMTTYARNAYEQAVVASWIYIHRADFGSPLGERAAEDRIEDFQLALTWDTLGIPGQKALGMTKAEFPVCLNCVGRPCQHGPLGSVAAQTRTRSGFASGIRSLIEDNNVSASVQLEGVFISEGVSYLTHLYNYAELLLIDQADVTRWMNMTARELDSEIRLLTDDADAIDQEAKNIAEPHCPLEVPIADMFRLMRQDRFEEALEILNNSSFLAGIFGLVCPQEHLCQAACVQGRLSDRPLPIDIGKLEYLIELTYMRINGELPMPEVAPFTGKYVAIIGSGPAGLQAAYDLAREGHKVVLFEHLHKVGGVLVYGIPTFRLPPELLEEKVRILKEMGVNFVTNAIIGEDGAYTIEEMRRSFDAVIVGVGAGQSNKMEIRGKVVLLDEKTGRARLEVPEYAKRVPIPGRALNGIYSAYHFLSWTYLMNAIKPGYDTPIPLSKNILQAFTESRATGEEKEVTVVVEGIGNVALDSGRTALRWINVLNRIYGTNVRPKIIFLYRRPREELDLKARAEELKHLREEGVDTIDIDVYELHQTVEYLGNTKGHIEGIRAIRYDRKGAKEGVLVDIPVDMVVEALGAKPATEILGPSIPLNRYGYIEIDNHRTMQVRDMDGSDGLAPVYAVGDCAEVDAIDERIMATAVLAATHGKRASEALIERLDNETGMVQRYIDIDKVFFKATPYRMHEILERRRIGKRELVSRPLRGDTGNVFSEQRIVEFTIYAPHVARRIRPGQFVTLMADEYSEKIPITYVGLGKIKGSIRLAILDAGESTVKINNMKKGDLFYAVTGPAGEPSIFTGLAGEVDLVGLGSGIAAIVGIAEHRADLDRKYKELMARLAGNSRADVVLSLIEEIWSELSLAKDDLLHYIVDAIRDRDYNEAKNLLTALAYSIEQDFPASELIADAEALVDTITMLEDSVEDEDELNLLVKQEVYQAIDDIWEEFEILKREKLLREISDFVSSGNYKNASNALNAVIGAGFETKVFLAVGNKDLLMYKTELEEAVGRENIFIALEDAEGFDPHAEGYASLIAHENRFFTGYGTIAFGDYLGRTHDPISGLLVAGPAFAMNLFVPLVREANRPDILSTRDVWMSTNPPMYCAYGGCLMCLVATEQAIPWRGCLGPEAEADMLIGDSIVKGLEMSKPQDIMPGVIFSTSPSVDREQAISDIVQALDEILYMPTVDGKLFVAISDAKGSFIAELRNGILEERLSDEDIDAVLENIDWERLGVFKPGHKIRFAGRISDVSGLELDRVMELLGLTMQGGSGAEDSDSGMTLDDLFSRSLDLSILGIEVIGEFREVSISPSGFSRLRAFLEEIGDRQKLEEILGLEGSEFIFVMNGANELVAIVIRNETRQKELLWIEGEASSELFSYLTLRASLRGSSISADLTVEEIKPGAILGPGATTTPASSALAKTGTWTTKYAEHDLDACVQCGLCALVCPEGAIAFDMEPALNTGRLVLPTNPDYCKGCDACVVHCPLKGYALKMIEKTDLRQVAVSLDTNPEGRGVVIEGAPALQFEGLFKEGIDRFKKALGLDVVEIISESESFVQVRYERGDIAYLFTFDKKNTRLILKPLRTFAVVGLESKNIDLADALRSRGFAVTGLISTKDRGFRDKLMEAERQGISVYAIEAGLLNPGISGSLQALLNDIERLRLARFVAVDTETIREIIGLDEYTKLVEEINEYTHNSIINSVDLLPTGNTDFDEVMASFAPEWQDQVRDLAPGHGLCPGCGQPTDTHLVLKVADEHGMAPVGVITTGCQEVSTTNWPFNSWRIPMVHGNYTASAAIVSGIFRVYQWFKKMGVSVYGDKEILPIVIMGDGGFAIGLNVISGGLEKGLPILYLVENNSGTQNTGAQASTLSMPGITAQGASQVKTTQGVYIPDIAKAHGPNVYYARVSNAYPEDFERKLNRAMEWIKQGRGPAVIESFNTACPTGWKSDATQSQEETSLSVQTGVGMTVLFEQVGNRIRITQPPLLRDGKIYINTEYMRSLEYELGHLRNAGGKRLLSDRQVASMISHIKKRREFILARELERRQPKKPGLPFVQLDLDALKNLLVLHSFNLPLESDLLIDRLDVLGLSGDEIEDIAQHRSEGNEFRNRQDVLRFITDVRYREVTERILDIYDTVEIRDFIMEWTETKEEGNIDFEETVVFEKIEDILKVPGIGPVTYDAVSPYLTLEPRRPHIFEYLSRQGRFRRLLGWDDEAFLGDMQRDVDAHILRLMAQHENDRAFFENFDNLLARGEKIPVEQFRYKSAREAHDKALVPARVIPADPERNIRILERRARLGDRVFEERWHGRGGQGAITAATLLATYAGEVEGIGIQAFPHFGVERAGAPVKAYVRMGNNIKQHDPVTEPDVVVVIDESLLELPEVLEGIKPGGFLLVNSKKPAEKILEELRAKGNALKDITLFSVDATGISIKHMGRNLPNIPMLAARIMVSRLTDADLGPAEGATDYIRQLLVEMFGEKIAGLNYDAMQESVRSIDAVSGAVEELIEEFLAKREPVEIDVAQPEEEDAALKSNVRLMNSNKAAAIAQVQSGVKYVPGYPTTPASSVVEILDTYQDKGLPLIVSLLPAEDSVGGELLGTALAGGMPATGTTSVALAYMFNQHLADMVGKRTPVVVNVPVRALNIGSLSIFPDETDIAMFRDYGVYLRARNAQEVYYFNIIAWRIAKKLRMPVFVVYTGFRNSHTTEPVEILGDYDRIEEYLGGTGLFSIRDTILDQESPKMIGPVVGKEIMMEQMAELFEDIARNQDHVIEEAFAEFERLFGIRFDRFRQYRVEDADEIIVVQGDTGETIELMVDRLRDQGRRVGVIEIATIRPFPGKELREALVNINPKIITVLDNAPSHYLYDDVVRSIQFTDIQVWGPVIYGLGGRDFFRQDAVTLYDTLISLRVLQALGAKESPVSLTRASLTQLLNEEAVTLGMAKHGFVEPGDALAGRRGARSIPAILDTLDFAASSADMPGFSRNAVFEKLTQGELLKLFGDEYYFGARRKYKHDLLMHALVNELAVRLSRQLLGSNIGTIDERTQAIDALVHLSDIEADKELARTSSESLRKYRRRDQVASTDQIIAVSAAQVIAEKKEFEAWIENQSENIAVVIIATAEEYYQVREYEDIAYIKVVGKDISEAHGLTLKRLLALHGHLDNFGGFRLGDEKFDLDEYRSALTELSTGI